MDNFSIVSGDIFKSQDDAWVCPVNCIGVAGSGLAALFRVAFPTAHAVYKMTCQMRSMSVGTVIVVPVHDVAYPSRVIYFPTKTDYRNLSTLEWIESGMESLVKEVTRHNIRSVSIPALGCGLGGLKFGDVSPIIESAVRTDGRETIYHLYKGVRK